MVTEMTALPPPTFRFTEFTDVLANLGSVDVEIDGSAPGVPTRPYLADAMPNPFNPRTTIQYGLTDRSAVRLDIFDVSGRLVRTLVDEEKPAGTYQVHWNGNDSSGRAAAAGVYYCRLEAGDRVEMKKLVMVK